LSPSTAFSFHVELISFEDIFLASRATSHKESRQLISSKGISDEVEASPPGKVEDGMENMEEPQNTTGNEHCSKRRQGAIGRTDSQKAEREYKHLISPIIVA
jgi:hypothetical protein